MIIIVKNKLLWKMFLCSLTWSNSNKLYSTNMKRPIITEPVLRNIKRVKSVTPLFGNLHLCARLFSCHLPEGLSLSQVVQGEEYVRVLAYAVVGEALQVDQQVMRYWNSTRFPMSLPGVVALKHTKKAAKQTKYINTHIRIQRHCVTVLVNIYTKASWLNRNICKLWNLLKFLFNFNLMCKYIKRLLHILLLKWCCCSLNLHTVSAWCLRVTLCDESVSISRIECCRAQLWV